MTVEQVLATEIEAGVEESLKTERGFDGTEVKEEEAKEEEIKKEAKEESTEGDKDKNDSEQNKVEEVVEQISGDGEEATSEGNGEGEEGKTEDTQATSDSKKSPEISEGVLGLAVQSGLSIADAQSFGNDQSLLKVVQIIGEQRQKNVPAKEEEKESQVSLLSDLPKLDPEQYEPEVIEAFSKMKASIQEQQEVIEQLSKKSQQFWENQAAQNEREVTAWFDQRVAGLGKQYEKALGEGSHGSLNQGSSQYAKREEIVDHISLLAAGYASTGRESPSLDILFDQATKFVLQDEVSEVKEKELSDRLRKRAKQHVARTGSIKVETLETAEASEKELVDKIDKQFFKNR